MSIRNVTPACKAALIAAFVAATPAHAYTFTTLYYFTHGTDGAQPLGGVVQDAAGTLYGETYTGGATQCTALPGQTKQGCGTLYSFSRTTGLKTLIAFTGPNGAIGGTTPALSGTTLYGNTQNGGTNGDGVLFSVHTDGSAFTLLHQFTGPDGRTPAGTLAIGPAGILYGITAAGGPKTRGVLFQLTPSGTYTILHAFTGGTDGSTPNVLLMAPSGALVGSTHYGGLAGICPSAGCGVIFEYVPATQKFSILHSFTGPTGDGGNPYLGSIGPGPAAYGIAGELFSLAPSVGFKTVGLFGMNDGGFPFSGPALSPTGTLVGVNSTGPYDFNASGQLYSETSGVITSLYLFNGLSDGGAPSGQPIITSTGSIIGTTYQGGRCTYCGTIYEYTP